MPVVLIRPAFERAVTQRIEWLAEHAPEEWLDSFLTALEELRQDLERFPEIGAAVQEDARVVVRQRRFPRGLPYLAYCAHLREELIREIYLTHLFHERQRRPQLDLSRWPW